MKRIRGSYENLLQGVSQQPASMRNHGQCTAQVNCSSDIVRGLCRRAPTEWVADIMGTDYTDWQFRYAAITDTARFLFMYRAGALRAFNIETGAEVPVSAPSGFAYIDGGPCNIVSIDNVAYVCNTSKITAMSPATHGTLDKSEFLIQILGGAFSREIEVRLKYKLDGVTKTVTVTHNTGEGVDATDSARLDTRYIATEIKNLLINTALDFNPLLKDDVIHVKPKAVANVTDLSVVVRDGSNNVNIVGYGATITNANKIPSLAPPGYTVRVVGSGTTDVDDYYLRFETTDADGAFGDEGVWRETVNPEVQYKFNANTMPHQMVWNADSNTITFGPVDWREREVGDDETNAIPSFIGNTINDIAVFQGRLVFASGASVIMSRTNKPTAFWNKSATVLSDDDPIDVESSLRYGVRMERLVLHNRDLIIFSAKAQFVVFGRNSITPLNVSLVVSVSFDSDLKAAPVETGNSAFFAIRYGDYTGVREFFTEASSDANNSTSVTAHVAQYLAGRAEFMAASSNFDMLVVSTDANDDALYTYQYVTMGADRAQAAWSTWILHSPVQYAFFIENRLYVVTKAESAYAIEFIDIDRHPDDGLTYQVHLDSKRTHVAVNKTVTVTDADTRVYVQGPGCPTPGMRAVVESATADTAIFQLDMQGGTVYSGYRYTSQYTPTRPFARDYQDRPKTDTALRVRMFNILFERSGAFKAHITNRYKDPQTVEFSARVVGDINNIIGIEAVFSGSLDVPFRENPEYADLTIECNEHTPLFLTRLQWEGLLAAR